MDIQSHHYKCDVCSSTFSEKKNLKRHLETVHLKHRPYQCEKCNFTTPHNSTLLNHKIAFHEGLKPHKCSRCNYASSYKKNLKRHIIVVHDKLKTHKCEMCSYKSAEKIHLKRHVSSVHLQLKPFKCHKCTYASTDCSKVKRHVNSVHNTPSTLIHDRSLENHILHCGRELICKCGLSTPNPLSMHKKAVHLELKPYKCKQCPFEASSREIMQEHVLRDHRRMKREPIVKVKRLTHEVAAEWLPLSDIKDLFREK